MTKPTLSHRYKSTICYTTQYYSLASGRLFSHCGQRQSTHCWTGRHANSLVINVRPKQCTIARNVAVRQPLVLYNTDIKTTVNYCNRYNDGATGRVSDFVIHKSRTCGFKSCLGTTVQWPWASYLHLCASVTK